MLLDRNTFLKLKKAGYAEMRAFCERLYRQGFEDGANADVDPNIVDSASRKKIINYYNKIEQEVLKSNGKR